MMNLYEPNSRMIEIEDTSERDADRPISDVARRMVRETELFLSYALTDGRSGRWIMLARDAALAGAR